MIQLTCICPYQDTSTAKLLQNYLDIEQKISVAPHMDNQKVTKHCYIQIPITSIFSIKKHIPYNKSDIIHMDCLVPIQHAYNVNS
jgi:hypothetical protein